MSKITLLLILYLVPFAKLQSDGLVVKTKSGLIEGQYVHSLVVNKSYYSFQGVPYAQPPLGELRFRPPVPPKPWDHILETKTDKYMCVQHLVPGGFEDCLYLNVYTPTLRNENSSDLQPVIVFIHGGIFISGSFNSTIYGPDYLIDKNIVLVTINYRLNVFGFLNAMEESCPGNVGLKDQVAALEWVQENIKTFNGDPKLVTLSGQSAGAASVQYHLQSKLSTGLFHRAIVQSGSTLNNWAFEPNPIDLIHKLGNVLNIDSTNITNFINELRQLPAEKLQEASQNEELLDTKHRTLRTRFIPSIEKDSPNAFLTRSSYSILEENKINAVPLLIGHVSSEGLVIFFQPFNITDYINDPFLLIPKALNIHNDTETQKLVLEQINYQYFNDVSLPFIVPFVGYEGDEGFVRGVRKTIEFLRQNDNIFHYVFDYTKKDNGLGVYHGGEMRYIFYMDAGFTETEEQKIIREQITTMWANFAKTGNPTPNEDPLLDNIIWPQLSKPEELLQYMYIGKQLEVRNDTWQEYYQFWEYIFNTYGQPPFYIY